MVGKLNLHDMLKITVYSSINPWKSNHGINKLLYIYIYIYNHIINVYPLSICHVNGFFKYSLQYITILSQYWIMTTVHISYIYILFFSPCYHHISPSGKAGSEYFPRQTGNNKRVIQWWLTGWGPNSLTKLANRTIIIIVYDTQITIFG